MDGSASRGDGTIAESPVFGASLTTRYPPNPYHRTDPPMLKVLLQNRYLIGELVARDVRSRYVGSMIGIFWSIINPLMQLILYTVIFSTVLNIRFGDLDSSARFAEYLFCALLPWMTLQEGITRSSRCFIESANLIKKIRFPLEVLPFSLVGSAFLHQLLGTTVFLAVLAFNRTLSWQSLPILLLLLPLQFVMTYGLSLVVACLNVFFRDIAQILGVFFMLIFWMTPIVYPRGQAAQAGELFAWVLNLNPLTHMVESYRFAFLGSAAPSPEGWLYWLVFSAGAVMAGRFVLERTRTNLVDLV